VIATVFVFRYSYTESARAALTRMLGTAVSFALCLVYLLILPFHAWGMAVLIGIGSVIVHLMGHPEETVTMGITTAVIMVVAASRPNDPWLQPILRLVDTAIGVAVGVATARVGVWASQWLST